MIILKKYKLIALKHSFPQLSYEYFSSFDKKTKELIYTTEIDDAMNFVNLADEDIEYYLELISDKVWQGQYQICPDVALIDLSAEINSNERVYNNDDHIKMKAIKKLTSQEIELLGLDDLGVYYNMKVDHHSDIPQINNPQINNLTSNMWSIGLNPILRPVDQLISSIQGDIDNV